MRHVPFAELHNVRDLGGYLGAGGRPVRWRTLYRADSLGKLAGEDLERFAELGIRTVIDLRHPWEITRDGRVPAEVEYHNLSVEHRPYDQAALGAEVAPGPYLAQRYAEVAADGAEELAAALRVIAESPAPIVFHCTSGKDRTGLLAALVLTLVGVSEPDVVADFALTGRATEQLRAHWETTWGDGRELWPGYGQAPEETMTLFLAGLRERYGSVEAYARTVLGADEGLVRTLQERLLEAR